MLDLASIVLGIAIVFVTFGDVFQSIIVPRPVNIELRPSGYLMRYGWSSWRWIAHRFISDAFREDFLGTYAPLMLVIMLIFWVASLIVGYGLIFFGSHEGLRPELSFGSALYFAGTSLLTIGYGDIVPTSSWTRFISVTAGASGFGIVAILTTYLFSIVGAYQAREAFVVMFSNRAGAPSSGVEFMETHARLDLADSMIVSLREAQHWMASVMETHLAYPVLAYFRSTHDDISWVGILGAILDATTLTITTLDIPSRGEAILTNRLGRHFVSDFAHYFELPDGGDPGIEKNEFDLAYERLQNAGISVRDRERSWERFAQVRSTYATHLNAMAQWWRIPPAQWIGDRSFIGHHQRWPLSAEVAELVDG